MADATISGNRRVDRIAGRGRASAKLALSIDIVDISPIGLRVRFPFSLPTGTLFRVNLPSGGERHARVAWEEEGIHGCEFVAPINHHDAQAMARGADVKERF